MSRLPGALALLLACTAAVAQAADGGPGWSEIKCARYTRAWSEALARRGTRGLGRDFLDSHAAFLASGCLSDVKVCPRSAEELDLANIMILAAMNSGTASTFPPFGCPR